MPATPPTCVLDSSALIPFLAVKRLDLLRGLAWAFLVTEHVRVEISATDPEQLADVEAAFGAEVLREARVDSPTELELFGSLSRTGRLGAGECSAIACAVTRGFWLGINDARASKQARALAPSLVVLGTKELIVEAIRGGLIDVTGADVLKERWAASHRFRLRIGSFGDLI